MNCERHVIRLLPRAYLTQRAPQWACSAVGRFEVFLVQPAPSQQLCAFQAFCALRDLACEAASLRRDVRDRCHRSTPHCPSSALRNCRPEIQLGLQNSRLGACCETAAEAEHDRYRHVPHRFVSTPACAASVGASAQPFSHCPTILSRQCSMRFHQSW